MKQKNSIGYNYVMNTIIQGSAYILPLIANPYVSGILGPEGMGQISYVTAILSYFTMFAVLGIPTYGIREVSKVKDNKALLSGTVYGIFSINLFMGLLVYAFFFIYVIFFLQVSVYRNLLLVMSPAILLNLIGIEWMYKGLEKFSVIAFRNVIFKLVTLALIFVCIHSRKDIFLYGVLTIFAAYGYSLWNFVGRRKYIQVRNMAGFEIRKHISPVLVFFSMTVATTIYTNLDMIMLGAMRGDYEAGIYDSAAKLKTLAVTAVSSLGAVLLPRIAALINQEKMDEFKRISEKALNLIVIFSVSLALCVGVNAKSLIYLFSGKLFGGAVPVLVILVPTFILIGMTNIIGIQMLIPLGQEKMVLASEIAGAVTDLAVNLALIPHYGAVGAAIGTLIAEIIVLVVQVYACRDYVLKMLYGIQFYKIFAAGIISGVVVLLIIRFIEPDLLKICCSALFFNLMYGCILFIWREKECIWIVKRISDWGKRR